MPRLLEPMGPRLLPAWQPRMLQAYGEDQPRDEASGRWTSGGAGGGEAAGGAPGEALNRFKKLYDRAADPDLPDSEIQSEIAWAEKNLSKDEAIKVAREFGVLKTLRQKRTR